MRYVPRRERAVFIGKECASTDRLLSAVKLKDFKIDMFHAADAKELITVCFDEEPALIMLDMEMESINTYIKVRDIAMINSLPVIAFTNERSESVKRLAEELEVYKLIVAEGPLKKCAAEFADAVTILLEYSDIKDFPKVRGHIVTSKYWHDPVREIGDYDQALSDLLADLGVRKTLAGHKYLLAAIKMQTALIGPPRPKYLYIIIADYYDTTPLAVEKAIRYAIETAWTHGDIYTQNRIFGLTTDASRGKPTNAEFIARLSLEFRWH